MSSPVTPEAKKNKKPFDLVLTGNLPPISQYCFKCGLVQIGISESRSTFLEVTLILPLTKAMLSPRPTLFITLLTNLMYKDIKRWCMSGTNYLGPRPFILARTHCKENQIRNIISSRFEKIFAHRHVNTKWKKELKNFTCSDSYILSSRQILGPITLAAPDTRRNAKCFGGQGADSPHLYFRGRVSAEINTDVIINMTSYVLSNNM